MFPHQGRARSRCNDDDLNEFAAQLAPACCGGDNQYCDPASGGIDESTGAITLPTPMQAGQPYCSPECSTTCVARTPLGFFSRHLIRSDLGANAVHVLSFEEFYSECHPRLERFAPDFEADSFLRVCQGIPTVGGGGGHRRAQVHGVPSSVTEPSI